MLNYAVADLSPSPIDLLELIDVVLVGTERLVVDIFDTAV